MIGSFTIDDEDTLEIDDAITLKLEGSTITVGIHIADVSAFVLAGGPIDGEASWRGCSVYLPGRVEPMLPHALSSNVCSLQPGVDRYAVTIEVAPDGTATAYRSAIRSDHRLSYPQVERMLGGHQPAADDLLEALRDARDLSGRLRRHASRAVLRASTPARSSSASRRAGWLRRSRRPSTRRTRWSRS